MISSLMDFKINYFIYGMVDSILNTAGFLENIHNTRLSKITAFVKIINSVMKTASLQGHIHHTWSK